MKESVIVGDLKVEPGDVGFGRLEGESLRDSQSLSVPIIVVNGSNDGPTLWVQAAIHGLEIPGIEVIRRLVREEIDPQKLNGVVKAVPVANPYAFQAGRQVAPQDNVDAHAVFPGDPGRSVSYKLANLLYTEGIQKCDYFIDLHTNYWPAVMFLPVPVCEDKDVMRKTIELAEVFGLPLSEATNVPGWPTYRAQNEGKPAFIVELLYHGWIDQKSVEVGVTGMLNVMKHIGMIEGEIETLPEVKVPPGWYGREFIRCTQGGIVLPLKEAGERFSKGEVVAIVRNIYGDVVAEVLSPEEGYVRTVLFGNPNQAVNSGEIIYSYLAIRPKESFFGLEGK